jgi:hypothetical protein
MAQAVGVPAVKPVETKGGCSYLLDPTDVMPTWNIGDPTIPPLPPLSPFTTIPTRPASTLSIGT